MMPRFRAHEVDPNEPVEIREISKNQLYTTLSSQYLLPPKDSKGVKRQYLVAVYTNQALRIGYQEARVFIAQQPKELLKRTPLLHLADLVTRLNVYLIEQGLMNLGFSPHTVPDQEWLFTIIRFVDRKNVLGAFQNELPNTPFNNTVSHSIHRAKQNTEHFLLGANHLMDNSRVYQAIRTVWELKQKLFNDRKELEELEYHLERVRARMENEDSELQGAIINAATVITSIGNNIQDGEEIFVEGNENNGLRAQAQEVIRMYEIS